MTIRRLAFERGGIVRAVASSAVATVADYLLFAALVSIGAMAAAATLIGCIVGGFLNFTVNRYWAFTHSGDSLVRSALRYTTVSGTSALANSLLVGLATSGLGVTARPAWVMVRGLVFLGLTYPLFRGWVFGARVPGGDGNATAVISSDELEVLSGPQLG